VAIVPCRRPRWPQDPGSLHRATPPSSAGHPLRSAGSSPHRRPQPVYGHDTPSGVATTPAPQGGERRGNVTYLAGALSNPVQSMRSLACRADAHRRRGDRPGRVLPTADRSPVGRPPSGGRGRLGHPRRSLAVTIHTGHPHHPVGPTDRGHRPMPPDGKIIVRPRSAGTPQPPASERSSVGSPGSPARSSTRLGTHLWIQVGRQSGPTTGTRVEPGVPAGCHVPEAPAASHRAHRVTVWSYAWRHAAGGGAGGMCGHPLWSGPRRPWWHPV